MVTSAGFETHLVLNRTQQEVVGSISISSTKIKAEV